MICKKDKKFSYRIQVFINLIRIIVIFQG